MKVEITGKRGRPPKNEPKVENGKALNKQNLDENPTIHRCTRCGKSTQIPKNKFFVSNSSPLFVSNEMYTHICCDCANQLFDEFKMRYGDYRSALIILCHYLDIYFSETLYESIKGNPNLTLGVYLRSLNGNQYKSKSFNNYIFELMDCGGAKTQSEIRDQIETRWSSSDLKNKQYVLSALGYDCFEDENYTENDRKFLFNTMADYLTDDVLEDQHKIQSVNSMVKTILQVQNIDSMITTELKKAHIDHELIKKLSEIKDKFVKSINSTANENGISAKSSGKSNKGSNTLTNIMKEMQEHGFEETKVNVVSSKLSVSYQEIAKLNAKALIEELNFTSDEYAQMVAQQSEIVSDLQSKVEEKTEEIRQLNIQIKQLKEEINAGGGK